MSFKRSHASGKQQQLRRGLDEAAASLAHRAVSAVCSVASGDGAESGGKLREFTDEESNIIGLHHRAVETSSIHRSTIHQLIILATKVRARFLRCVFEEEEEA